MRSKEVGEKLKSGAKNLLYVTLPTLLLLFLLLELFFRFVIPASELPVSTFDPDFHVLKYRNDNRGDGIHTIGKRGQYPTRYHVNNEGWINIKDYEREKQRKRIAVIGDSFVAAFQVNTGEAFFDHLEKALNDSIEVYSFGYSGSPFSQYLQMAKYATHHFQPDALIVNLVYNDFTESIKGAAGKDHFWTYKPLRNTTYELIRPQYKLKYLRIKQLISYSALYRYFFLNVRIHKPKRKRPDSVAAYQAYQAKSEIKEVSRKEQVAVITSIMEAFKLAFPKQRIIFVMDGPRAAIYHDWQEKMSTIWYNKYFAETCKVYDIEFIDLTPYFVADYKVHQQKFEFAEDGHWNAYAHRLVGQVIHKYLEEHPIGN